MYKKSAPAGAYFSYIFSAKNFPLKR
jgi:hypothetical protein